MQELKNVPYGKIVKTANGIIGRLLRPADMSIPAKQVIITKTGEDYFFISNDTEVQTFNSFEAAEITTLQFTPQELEDINLALMFLVGGVKEVSLDLQSKCRFDHLVEKFNQ